LIPFPNPDATPTLARFYDVDGLTALLALPLDMRYRKRSQATSALIADLRLVTGGVAHSP
jgi:hypothetical protein